LNSEKEIFGEDEKLLDNQNLSKILNVSYRTLQRYRSEGALLFLKHGQKIYYKASAVHEFVNRSGFDHWDKKWLMMQLKQKRNDSEPVTFSILFFWLLRSFSSPRFAACL
jgi:hypothetical protein